MSFWSLGQNFRLAERESKSRLGQGPGVLLRSGRCMSYRSLQVTESLTSCISSDERLGMMDVFERLVTVDAVGCYYLEE